MHAGGRRDQGHGCHRGIGSCDQRKRLKKTHTMDQNDEVVSLEGTAGIISHFVVIGADQGPVDGADGEGQQLL